MFISWVHVTQAKSRKSYSCYSVTLNFFQDNLKSKAGFLFSAILNIHTSFCFSVAHMFSSLMQWYFYSHQAEYKYYDILVLIYWEKRKQFFSHACSFLHLITINLSQTRKMIYKIVFLFHLICRKYLSFLKSKK